MIHDLLDEAAAARLLALQQKTLTRWRWEGRGPAYCKIGGAVRYRLRDLEAFIAGSVVQHG
jgi:hypothetical protein